MEMDNGNGMMVKCHLFHTRFAPEIKDEFIAWIEASCSQYIVAEETANRVHYHACYMSPITQDTIRKRLCNLAKAKGLEVAKGKANSYYGSVKVCTDESYVCKEGRIVTSKGYTAERIAELIEKGKRFISPIVATPATAQPQVVVVRPTKKLTIAERFIQHCVVELRWKKDYEFGLDNYDYGREQVLMHMTMFLRGKFNDPQGIIIARNCLYEFANEDLKSVLERKYTHNIKNFV